MTRKTNVDLWAAAARWAAGFGILAASVRLELDTTWTGAIITVALATGVFWLMKVKARRKHESRIAVAELRASIGATGKESEI